MAAQLLGLGLGAAPGLPLEFLGGSLDDQLYARAAAGLRPGMTVLEGDFQKALEAIRATDRFRSVEGSQGRVVLDPWPPFAGLVWRGDAPSGLRRTLFPELRKGSRPGNLRLEAMRAAAQDRLVAAGYPQAKVKVSRLDGDTRILVEVAAGPPNLIRAVEVVGSTGSFMPHELVQAAKVVPGRTLWCRAFELDCLKRLRKKVVGGRFYEFGHKRYECQVDLDWDAGGLLRITVEAGPIVKLGHEGKGLGWSSLKDLVPLARADRYSPDLLDEGERRIVRLLRSKGYLDPQVTHRTEVVREGPRGPEEIKVIYTLKAGTESDFGKVAFEGYQAVGLPDLKKTAEPAQGWLLPVKAKPETMDEIETRIQALYESRGFTDVKVRRQVDLHGGKADLTFRIREGRQRLISWVRVDLPPGGFGDPWGLGECLPLLFSDKAVLVGARGETRVFTSDRREMEGVEGVLESSQAEGRLRMTLRLSRPIPLLKADFFRVYTAIRQQRLVPLGVMRPTVRSQVVDADGETGILIEVPDQATERVERVVVQGSDKTRAKAVLREIKLQPGDPLDQTKLSQSQGRLGSLGAFQRVETSSLAEQAAQDDGSAQPSGPPSPWKPGDLLFRTQERSPWVVTNSFGYDRTQGYYIGTGVQRLNVGGMGRTLDFDVRAGDGTLHNPTLRELFPTGQYTTSLDDYSVAYTDPWFMPGWILPDNTSFRTEAAYIQEERYIYAIHRRRELSSLMWPLLGRFKLEVGYRFERVDTQSNVPGLPSGLLSTIAQYPTQSTISAPYFQVVRDTRDNAFDPTSGMYSLVRFEAASQLFLTSKNSSFLKVDLRNQWTWPVGYKAEAGVVSLGMRLGIARPTATTAEELPLSERFFGGGNGTVRGVEPNFLGPIGWVPLFNADGTPTTVNANVVNQIIPLGGQVLAVANLEYRFPLLGQWLWGEVFVDSGQIYDHLQRGAFTPQAPNTIILPTSNPSGPPYTGTATINPANGFVSIFNSATNVTTIIDPVKGPSSSIPDTLPPGYPTDPFPPLRTSVGLGLIFKIGIPVKLEYAADANRIMGWPRNPYVVDTQLKNILISAGFQF